MGGQSGLDLTELLHLAESQCGPDLRGYASTELAALAPVLAAAELELERGLGALDIEVGVPARKDCVAVLARRLERLHRPLWRLEQTAVAGLGSLPGPRSDARYCIAAWRGRKRSHPVFAALVGVVVQNWLRYLLELFERLASDRDRLKRLVRGANTRAVHAFTGDLGDQHDGGRAVAVLTLADATRVVYKPKDLRVTHAFREFVLWLERAGLEDPLRVPEIEVRDGYAWEEFISFEPCRSKRDVARFYVRMGMFLRVLQLFEGRDFWLDNLIAHADEPIFIDYEMLLQPRRPTLEGTLDGERRARELLREAVIHTGAVTLHTTVAPGRSAEEFGALTPVRPFERPVQRQGANGEAHALWHRHEYAPHLDGVPMRADQHLPELLLGYRRMHATLLSLRDRLLGADSPIAAFAGLPVRYIYRHTWDCQRVLDASTSPACLGDSARREALFAELLAGGSAQLTPNEAAVVRHEIESFRALDIPYFLSQTDATVLSSPSGRLSEDFFEGSALERVRRRISDLPTFPLELHEALLESELSTGPHRSYRVHHSVHAEHATGSSPGALLSAALSIGDILVGAALGRGQERAWIGLTYDCFRSLRRVDTLEPDILSGTLGIAIVLSDLFAATGLERFRQTALGALHPASAAGVLDAWQGLHPGEHPPAGAFVGAGAHIYALQRCGRALDCPSLVQQAEELAQRLPLQTLCALNGLDVLSGSTGLLLALLALAPKPALRARARELVSLLQGKLADPATRRSAFPAGDAFCRCLPDTDDGLALAATRFAAQTRTPPVWALQPAAARDSTGHTLTRLALADGDVAVAAARCLLSNDGTGPSDWLEQLEVALAAAPILHEAAETAAWRCAERLLDARAMTGTWFFDRLSRDEHDLSAISGISALAHAFLRLHSPDRFESIRLLE